MEPLPALRRLFLKERQITALKPPLPLQIQPLTEPLLFKTVPVPLRLRLIFPPQVPTPLSQTWPRSLSTPHFFQTPPIPTISDLTLLIGPTFFLEARFSLKEQQTTLLKPPLLSQSQPLTERLPSKTRVEPSLKIGRAHV